MYEPIDDELDAREADECSVDNYNRWAKGERDAADARAAASTDLLVKSARAFLKANTSALSVTVEAHYCDADRDDGMGVKSWAEVYTRVRFSDGAVFYKEEVHDTKLCPGASDAYYIDDSPGPVATACLELEEAMRDKNIMDALEIDSAVTVTRDAVEYGDIERWP